MTTTPDIFLSYSREDHARAEMFASAFKAAGLDVWWDMGLRAGEAYDEVTEAALRNAKAVVVLWSKRSVTSRWVRAEATLADRNKTLVPCMIEACDRPIMFELTQTAELMHWQGDGTDAAFRSFLDDVRRFVARATEVAAGTAPAPAPPTRGNLPRRLEPLIGREAELSQIRALLAEASLVTLTGPGGIGKTRLAIEVARQAALGHQDGAWLVELAPITDASAIPGAIARAMGIELRDEPAREIVERLRDWKSLILLDNCEHVIEAASGLIEQILQHAPEVRFLTTSQEILGLEGERVVRLRSLLEEDAEKLFLRAARAADPEFAPKPSDGATIKSICARLDGVALAIEMAAARAPTLGVAGLLARLDDRFRVLTAGRRTALPRQRTLQATLDWSHSLLKPSEAAVFRRLAVFAGGCTMAGACGVASDGGLDEGAVEEALASLVAKSLVVIDRSDGAPRYRLLETMRAYAQQKLAEAGETQALQRRHAAYFAAFFEPTLALRSDLELDDFGQYRAEVANLLAGLEWAFGPSGDVAMGGVLVAHGFTVFDDQQRYVDTCNWAERALSAPAELPTHIRMRLIAARSWGALQSGVPDPALIFASTQLVTEGSDPLARFLTLLTIVLTNTTLRRGVDLALVREEFKALGRTRIGGLMVDFGEIMRVYYQHPLDLLRLRAATDALVKSATQAKAKLLVFMAMAHGSGTDAPWEDDPDRAIVMVRALLSDVLDTGDQSATLAMVRFLGERLVAALCRRNAPGDAEEARALVQRLLKFCSTANTDAFAHLSWLALVEERFEHAVHLLGWSRRAVAEVQHPWTSSLERQLRAAISTLDFNRLMEEGSRLTSREAYDLALGTGPAEGARRG
jgi:predicted ATPase